MKPNIVIFKVDDKLYDCPITGGGDLIGKVQSFESSYTLDENVIVFGIFDTHTSTSIEVCRFLIDYEDKPKNIKELLEKEGFGSLKIIVKHLFNLIDTNLNNALRTV